MTWKRECAQCEYCADDFCTFFDMEIIVGRMNIADECAQYKKRREHYFNQKEELTK